MRRMLLLLVMAVLPLSTPAAAQAGSRAPAVVVISSDSQAGDTPFRIARFAGKAPRDVILLSPGADAAILTRAVEALLAARRQTGGHANTDAMLRVRPRSGATRRPPANLPWAARVVEDVRAAAPREVPGIGKVRAVQIWLPTY